MRRTTTARRHGCSRRRRRVAMACANGSSNTLRLIPASTAARRTSWCSSSIIVGTSWRMSRTTRTAGAAGHASLPRSASVTCAARTAIGARRRCADGVGRRRHAADARSSSCGLRRASSTEGAASAAESFPLRSSRCASHATVATTTSASHASEPSAVCGTSGGSGGPCGHRRSEAPRHESHSLRACSSTFEPIHVSSAGRPTRLSSTSTIAATRWPRSALLSGAVLHGSRSRPRSRSVRCAARTAIVDAR